MLNLSVSAQELGGRGLARGCTSGSTPAARLRPPAGRFGRRAGHRRSGKHRGRRSADSFRGGPRRSEVGRGPSRRPTQLPTLGYPRSPGTVWVEGCQSDNADPVHLAALGDIWSVEVSKIATRGRKLTQHRHPSTFGPRAHRDFSCTLAG